VRVWVCVHVPGRVLSACRRPSLWVLGVFRGPVTHKKERYPPLWGEHLSCGYARGGRCGRGFRHGAGGRCGRGFRHGAGGRCGRGFRGNGGQISTRGCPFSSVNSLLSLIV